MKTMTPWKTYNGISVYVDDSGDFCAEVNGILLQHANWEGLRARIEDEKKTDALAMKLELDCVALIQEDNGDYSVRRLTLTGLNRNNSSLKWSGPTDNPSVVLPYTEKNSELLKQLAMAKSTVQDIQQAIKNLTIDGPTWGRIGAPKYNEELRKLKARYDDALKGSGGGEL